MKNNFISLLLKILTCFLLLLSGCHTKKDAAVKKSATTSKAYNLPPERPLPDLGKDGYIKDADNENHRVEIENKDPASAPVLNRLATKQIIYTKHARCRMECRHIDEREVKDALQTGHINERKSNVNDTPCPTYAIETRSPDGQLVRIVFADCDHITKVVTVIDLENEFHCDCK